MTTDEAMLKEGAEEQGRGTKVVEIACGVDVDGNTRDRKDKKEGQQKDLIQKSELSESTNKRAILEYACSTGNGEGEETVLPVELARTSNNQGRISQPGAFADGGSLNQTEPAQLDPETGENNEANVLPPESDPSAENSGLVEAREVQDVMTPKAQEVDATELERMALKEKRAKQCRWAGYGLVVTLAIGLALILVAVFIRGGRKDAEDERGTIISTENPTESPTGSPSLAPTAALDTLLQDLPPNTLESLKNYSTPQWQAWTWLENHPELFNLEDWRKKQLFALVTFYYAMEGPHWPEKVRDHWLLHSDECFWFSSEFGQFTADGSYEQRTNYDQTPCNSQGEFQHLLLGHLGLSGLSPFIPPEMAFLTSLTVLGLPGNQINATFQDFVPSQIYQLKNLTDLNLWGNALGGGIPSQLGLLGSLKDLLLRENQLKGPLPSQLGLLTSITDLSLHANQISGNIPSTLGLLTSMTLLNLGRNNLEGSIPSEIGLLTGLEHLKLRENQLTGTLLSDFGKMAKLEELLLYGNSITGPIPSQLGLLTHMTDLNLHDNYLSSEVPQELDLLGINGSLTMFALERNPDLAGIVPESLCYMSFLRLTFDCKAELCGCCWCPCLEADTACSAEQDAFGQEWPGGFPTPINSTNAIAINIHTDDYPEETMWEWSVLDENGEWEVLDSGSPPQNNSLFSYTTEVQSEAIYRLGLVDVWGDGNCCEYGLGWFTITNATASNSNANGTVIWKATGKALKRLEYGVESNLYVVEASLDVYLWIDENGNARQVDYDPNEGYSLIQSEVGDLVHTDLPPDSASIASPGESPPQ